MPHRASSKIVSRIKSLLRPLIHKSRILHELMLLVTERRGPWAFMRGLQWILLGLFKHKTVVSTEQGTFAISTRDAAIARHLYCDEEFELNSIKSLPELLPRAGFPRHTTIDTLFDIGANIGVISIGMVKLGIARRAVAIEPEPRNLDLLEENIRLNGLADRFTCIHGAVSDKSGSFQLELSPVNHGDHRIRKVPVSDITPEKCAESGRSVLEVECRTLDAIVSGFLRSNRIPGIWFGLMFKGTRASSSRAAQTISSRVSRPSPSSGRTACCAQECPLRLIWRPSPPSGLASLT